MTVSGRQDMGRLCYAKLYEFEAIAGAEERIRSESEEIAKLLEGASVKALGDYRSLLRIVRRQPKVSAVKLPSRCAQDILLDIIRMKESWLGSARKYCWEASGREKDLLLRICESEEEEIRRIRKCVS